MREKGDQLCRDQYILKETKSRQKNEAIAWTDNKLVYDMVLQIWIIECLKMYKISGKLISKAMKNWKVKLTAGG